MWWSWWWLASWVDPRYILCSDLSTCLWVSFQLCSVTFLGWLKMPCGDSWSLNFKSTSSRKQTYPPFFCSKKRIFFSSIGYRPVSFPMRGTPLKISTGTWKSSHWKGHHIQHRHCCVQNVKFSRVCARSTVYYSLDFPFAWCSFRLAAVVRFRHKCSTAENWWSWGSGNRVTCLYIGAGDGARSEAFFDQTDGWKTRAGMLKLAIKSWKYDPWWIYVYVTIHMNLYLCVYHIYICTLVSWISYSIPFLQKVYWPVDRKFRGNPWMNMQGGPRAKKLTNGIYSQPS